MVSSNSRAFVFLKLLPRNKPTLRGEDIGKILPSKLTPLETSGCAPGQRRRRTAQSLKPSQRKSLFASFARVLIPLDSRCVLGMSSISLAAPSIPTSSSESYHCLKRFDRFASSSICVDDDYRLLHE